MTIVYTILAAIAAVALLTLLLPRKAVVTRTADMDLTPDQVVACISSTEGFQAFNPYKATDPDLKITPFGPAAGVGAGFRFEGKEGKGTQTIVAVDEKSVTYQIDLGAMGKPVQIISAAPHGAGARVTWTVTSDLGYNPIFRVVGLFMDRMLGQTYELGLERLKAAA
ncbi:MAG: SRPBCC family protein [Pseudomonadota bacterium]